jgi:hypothetical protein
MKQNYLFCQIFLIVILFFIQSSQAGDKISLVQDSVVLAPDVSRLPDIDGRGDDDCWKNVPWQSVNQVWIPYDAIVDSSDYYGRYKVVWSSKTNLLYFLIEVTDDVFVDGYNSSGGSGTIYDYDISEVFIDENMSGGEHVYDGFGTNAENAFAYHIYAPLPKEGSVTTTHYVDDIAGTSYSYGRPDYTSHFPDFALRVTGHTAVREFSLIVYNDTYDNSNKDASRSQLVVGKEMGLSIAYCDNDDLNENPKKRDNMFGSVWEPPPGNRHWWNADYFGRVKLVSAISSSVKVEQAVPTNPK